jgi:7,8-dihydropterin-6-yl-methyl-4-(beta-D-ribofuranosyl)aminobenzene 5'-phosphate synthase
VQLTCLIDNCVQHSSALWGEHGLSFLIETETARVLWDTGQSGTVLAHNLEALKLRELPLTALALSHAHYDHTGGLEQVLAAQPGIPLYGHADLLRPRYGRREHVAIGMPIAPTDLSCRADLRLSSEPQEIAPGVRTIGDIQPRPYPMGASPSHAIRVAGQWMPDPYHDDQSLVLEVAGGVVLLCGCCHAGLRNTLATLRHQTDAPLVAVLGGTHLAGVDAAELQAIIEVLQNEGAPALYLNHCTGTHAIQVLAQVFGERAAPCPAGTVISF